MSNPSGVRIQSSIFRLSRYIQYGRRGPRTGTAARGPGKRGKPMLMLYFSGTGNSRYVAEAFSRRMEAECHSIEETADFAARLTAHVEVAVCYPVYCSGVPRLMREFAIRYQGAFQGKKVLIFCTQMLYSGDGARAFTDLFPPGWFTVLYAEHFFMPGNLCNVLPAWTFGEGFARRRAEKAEEKIERICRNLERGRRVRRGFGRPSRLLGGMQRHYLLTTEDKARDAVTIGEGCTGCGLCASRCPAGNLLLVRGRPVPQARCMFCYRCVNLCPRQAITVCYDKTVKAQYHGVPAEK